MLSAYLHAAQRTELIRRLGKVTQFFGLIVESNGPDVFLGELCEIYSQGGESVPVAAEVVGIRDGKVLLMPYGELRGIGLGSEVIATGRPVEVNVGNELLGRVVDAFGKPLDGKPLSNSGKLYPLYKEPINPLKRPRINKILETGVRAVDTLLTVGRGQRMGIFAGSGVGKSTLMGMIARNMNADVNVIALIGERGREVADFIEQSLGDEGLKRSVVVVATSDQPALVRLRAALAATAIAEYFRDQGMDVVLTMDSITRFAMAQRELGLAIGEPPTARGYTPSTFAVLPKLLERGGIVDTGGAITAFYTVLVEGDDINDPIADSIRAILDGCILLSRELANQRHFPSIDVLQSNSRLISHLVNESDLDLVRKLVALMSAYERSRDMVEMGAYRAGTNRDLDDAIRLKEDVSRFLCQRSNEAAKRSEGMKALQGIVDKLKVRDAKAS